MLNKCVLGDPVVYTLRHCVTDWLGETWQLFFLSEFCLFGVPQKHTIRHSCDFHILKILQKLWI